MFSKLLLHLKWKMTDIFPFAFRLNATKRKGDVQVLCFHGICPRGMDFINARFYYDDRFLELITALKETSNVISLQQWLENDLDADHLNVLLTFDDGYRNNSNILLPLIEKLEVPVTLFVTAQEEPLWMDLFDVLVAEDDIPPALYDYFPGCNAKNLQQIKRRISEKNVKETEQISQLLRVHFLKKQRLTSPVMYELLSDSELQNLASHPLVALANHSARHLNFTTLSDSEISDEINAVRQRLRKVGAGEMAGNIFAYPFGAYDSRTREILNKMGVMQFAADGKGIIGKFPTDRLVVHPFLSTRNMVRAVHRGKY